MPTTSAYWSEKVNCIFEKKLMGINKLILGPIKSFQNERKQNKQK